MPHNRKTLTRYIIEAEHHHTGSTGDFSGLLSAVATAVKIISNQVSRGALAGPPASAGPPGAPDGTGEPGLPRDPGATQRRLDEISARVLTGETEWTGHLAAVAPARSGGIHAVPAGYRRGKYLLVFDALDGAEDIDANASAGTIFSILRSPEPHAEPRPEHFLQPGTAQACAGFALYGPSTLLVLTTGEGVDGFTLDRDIGSFVLTHPQLRVPADTTEFAINAAGERFWEAPVRRYISEALAGASGPRGRDFSMRWIASLVAETYRILTRGGVFLCPRDSAEPPQAGRRRLLHECNPVAFLIEQAGGLASTGSRRVMEVQPAGLQQRVPLIFGSAREVERIERYHRDPEHGREPSFDDSLFNTRSLFRIR